jgi:hypothetical protein
MKVRDFFFDLNEANLTGKSRTGQVSNWDYYVVRNFDKNTPFFIDKDTVMLDFSFNETIKLKQGDEIRIDSIELVNYNRSNYAKVNVKGTVGLVNINSILKPTTSISGSIIPGGKNSKEFTPDKLGLEGKKFSNTSSMITTIQSALKSKYGDSIYFPINKYISDCIFTLTGTSLKLDESFSRNYRLSSKHSISTTDVRILSKNFGEIIGALYILQTNKKAKSVEFPTDVSQGLYDFIMVQSNDLTNYYSVKSKGGSSTSIFNVNFVLNNFSKNNTILQKHKKEVEVIRNLMNNRVTGTTTLTNIEKFYNTILVKEKSDIINRINKISKVTINNLSPSDLTKWFNSMVITSSFEDFQRTMLDIYTNILGGAKTTPKVLKEIYNSKSGDKYDHGYLYYPMGQYIVSYLNEEGDYKKILNLLLNFGSYIHQLTVDMSLNSIDISITSFKESEFRFTYNAGSKYPANRPLGFKKL